MPTGPIGFILGFAFCFCIFTDNFKGALLIAVAVLAVAAWDCMR